MVKFTHNNQKEYKSYVTLLYWLEPWFCMNSIYDLGIDLYIQPFDERERDINDNSLYTFNKRLLIQLKSSGSYDEISKKHYIDNIHIHDWKRQDDLIIFMKYYIPENAFYYMYIDEIEINENQKGNTIYLDKKLDFNNITNFKEEVLDKLSPIKFGEIECIPSLTKGESIYSAIIDFGRKQELQIDENDNINNQKILSAIHLLREKILKKNNIDSLRLQISKNDTIDNRLKLIQSLYINENIHEAKIEAIALNYKHNNIEDVKVLLYLLNKNIRYEELTLFKPIFYLKGEKDKDEDNIFLEHFTKLTCYINNQKYIIQEYSDCIYKIPCEEIKNISIEVPVFPGKERDFVMIIPKTLYLCESYSFNEKIIFELENKKELIW